MELRRPADAIVSRDAPETFFAVEDPVALRAGQPASRAERDSIAESRQSQWRSVPVGSEIKEVVVRMKKLGGVIAGACATAGPEVTIRFDARSVAARDVVRHEIDDRLEAVGVQPFDELPKFRQPFRWIDRVIRANVEVILDRVRTARQSLQQIGVVSRLTELRIIGRRRLLQNAGQPDVGKPHSADRSERGVINIGEFSHAVFRKRSVSLARLVVIAEKPDKQLVDANALLFCRVTAAQRQDRLIFPQIQLMVMRNVFIAESAILSPIRASPEPAPAVVRIRIFRVNDEVDARTPPDDLARNAKEHFVVADFCGVGLLAFAPAPAFPSANNGRVRLAAKFYPE